MPSLIDSFGLAAAGLLTLAFALKPLLILRILALAAALCLVAHGALQGAWWIVGAGLGFGLANLWHILQITRLSRRIGTALDGKAGDVSAVQSLGAQVDIASGAAVFRRGEPVNAFYIIERGRVHLQEVGVDLGPGDILGEIGFFTHAASRTATAICTEPTRVHVLTEDAFRRLQFQDPNFGMAVMRTAMRRLADGMGRNPAAYQGLVGPLRGE